MSAALNDRGGARSGVRLRGPSMIPVIWAEDPRLRHGYVEPRRRSVEAGGCRRATLVSPARDYERGIGREGTPECLYRNPFKQRGGHYASNGPLGDPSTVEHSFVVAGE